MFFGVKISLKKSLRRLCRETSLPILQPKEIKGYAFITSNVFCNYIAQRISRKKRLSSGSITSEISMSAISFGSGSSGGAGLSRTSTPPIIGASPNFNPTQYYPTGNHQHARRQTPPYYPPHQLSPGLSHTSASSPLGQIQNLTYNSREGYPYDRLFRSPGSEIDSPDMGQHPTPNRHPRRRQTIPGHSHHVMPTLPESHMSDMVSPSAYGQMGIPDPHAPAFIPSRYR